MICVSLADKNIDQLFLALENPMLQMAEIRLDSCPLDADEIEDLFSSIDKPLIATYRLSDASMAAEAESKLLVAIRSGAAYIDLDIDDPAMMCKRLRREARLSGTLLIRSFHDYEGTDSVRALCAVVEKGLHLGADIVKIATTAASEADLAKIAKLYETFSPENLVAFCMGEFGRASRIDCLRCGSPFSYACLEEKEETALGQYSLEQMYSMVYGAAGGRLERIGKEAIEIGCSKSCAQRAIILAAIASGESHIDGYTPCADNEAALSMARALGAGVAINGKQLIINGTGGRVGEGAEVLHAGESGFLARMCIPLWAALSGKPVRITGEKTLLHRPLPGAKEMLAAFGVTIDGETVPMNISGALKGSGSVIKIDGSGGSQLVSGLLAALPLCEGGSQVRLENPKSIPYIFMTLDLMRQFGVNVSCEMEGGEEFAESQEDWSLCDAITFTIEGGQHYKAANVALEADWSAAANFMTAGAIFGKADIKGLDTKSLQADLSILDILPMAGAAVSQEEESGIIHVVRGPLRGFEVDASNCPDLVPILSVLAAFCQGESVITGVARLATKESNRPGVIVQMLEDMGVRARLRGDKLQIEGRSLESRMLSSRMLKGGTYPSHGDHRIVMALRVASLGAEGQFVIDGEACVAKSFPDFIKTFNLFAGE